MVAHAATLFILSKFSMLVKFAAGEAGSGKAISNKFQPPPEKVR